jgi:hypothetical protein
VQPPRLSMHATLRPNLSAMRRKEPVYILLNTVMVYRVESIFDIKVQDNGYGPFATDAQRGYCAVYLAGAVALCASMPAEAFLCVIHKPIVFHGVIKSLVYDEEEERVPEAAYWSKIRHEQG